MTLLDDIRYGLRMLASKPGVTAAAVLSLALGVGANTAVFSLIHAVVLRELPVQEPDELVILGPGLARGRSTSDEPEVDLFSYPRYRRLRDDARSLSDLAAVASTDGRVYLRTRDQETPTPASARLVSGEYFTMLGVRSAVGRLLGPGDDQTVSAHPVIALDYGYWQDRFGGDESIVGQPVTLGESTFTVIGVVEQSFSGERPGERPDIYAPLLMQPEVQRSSSFLARSDFSFLILIGRLAHGSTIESAEAELATLWQSHMMAEAGEEPTEVWLRVMEREQMTLQPGNRGYWGYSSLSEMNDPLWLLFAITAAVMLISCANVANLLLARSTARRRELNVRAALGAGRLRLFRQLLTESLLLATVAGCAALLVAVWSRDVILAMSAVSASELGISSGIDWQVLAYAAAISLLTGLLCGVVPAMRAGSAGGALRMRQGRGMVGGFGKIRSGLVVAQATLSLVLIFGAGLFVESLEKIAQTDTGMSSETLLTVFVDPRGVGIGDSEQPAIARRVLEAVESVPGVQSAAMALLPVFGTSRRTENISVAGYNSAPDEDMGVRMFYVTPGYFETVGTSILAGRPFGPEDDGRSRMTAIVDQAFADRFFQGRSPVGESIGPEGQDDAARIVGLARNAKLNGVREDAPPTVYVSAYAMPDALRGLMVRSSGDPAAVGDEVRQAIATAEPRLPVVWVQTAESRLEQQSGYDRMLLFLTSGFGGLALLIAAIGLYGVLSFRVAGRTSEIGLRMAVGADRRDVLGLVLKEGLLLAGAGVALGAIAAPFAGRAIGSFLYQTEPWSISTIAVAATVLLSAALLAGLAPSLRAAALDPVVALREE